MIKNGKGKNTEALKSRRDTKKIASRYITRGDRRRMYQNGLETSSLGNTERLRSLYQAANKSLDREEERQRRIRKENSDLQNYIVRIFNTIGIEVEFFDNKSNTENKQTFKTTNGKVIGYTEKGKIYLNKDEMNPNILIHEYTHI